MLKSNLLLILAGTFLMVGCQRVRNSPPESPLDVPLIIDGAMQRRDWPLTHAVYASGDTVAKPTGFAYETRWGQSEWHYPLEETPLFIGQTLFLPVMAFITPPWRETRYTGATVPTTYNAIPAMPESGMLPSRTSTSY